MMERNQAQGTSNVKFHRQDLRRTSFTCSNLANHSFINSILLQVDFGFTFAASCSAAVNEVKYSPDGTLIACVEAKALHIWAAESVKKLWTLHGSYHRLEFSPDNQ